MKHLIFLLGIFVLCSTTVQASDSLDAKSEVKLLVTPIVKLSDIGKNQESVEPFKLVPISLVPKTGLAEGIKLTLTENKSHLTSGTFTIEEMAALDDGKTFMGTGSGVEDFKSFKFFYRRNRFNLWGSGGQDKSVFLNSSFKAIYFEWLQKTSDDEMDFVGPAAGYSTYTFAYVVPKNTRTNTPEYKIAGNGTELKINITMCFQQNNIAMNTFITRFGVSSINQSALTSTHDITSAYTLGYAEFELDLMRDESVNAFNRLKIGGGYYYPLGASAEATDRVSGEVTDAETSNLKSLRFRAEQNILSQPISKKLSLTAGVVGQYRHLSEGVRDLYSLGGIFSGFYNFNEMFQFSVTQEFEPSNKGKDNSTTQMWFAVNVPVALNAMGIRVKF